MIIKNVKASERFKSCNVTDLTGICYIKSISGTFGGKENYFRNSQSLYKGKES